MTSQVLRDAPRPFPYVGMVALAAGSFSIVTVEVLPTGLLPAIARSFGSTEALVGTLVSVFAFAVVLFSAPLTHLTRRLPRKTLVIVTLAIATGAGFAAAIAPNFLVLALIRVIGGTAHGLYWSVVGAYPSYLVPAHQIGRAVAFNSAGTSLAGVLGLPLGTWVGQLLGWQWAFAGISAIGLVALATIVVYLPAARGAHELPTNGGTASTGAAAAESLVTVPAVTASVPIVTASIPARSGSPSGNARSEQSISSGVRAVVVVCLMTAIYMGGAFAFSTYVAPMMRDVVGLPESALSGILLVQGGIGFISVLVTGWVLASRPRRWLLVGMAAQVALVATFWLLAPVNSALALTLFWAMAMVGGAVPMLLQVVMLRVAPESIRDVSLSFYTVSFNVGIGGGAALGAAIVQGWGVHQVALANTVLAVAALALYFGYTIPRARAARRGVAA